MNTGALSKKDIQLLMDEIVHIYSSDDIPWVVGYSGGKDSTAALQLVWYALKDHIDKNSKPIYVITVDTMVESPVVSAWVKQSIAQIQQAADDQGLPIMTRTLMPKITDTFWVNLLGRGYPFPKTAFRWCTDRLKIKPTNEFVQNMIAEHGEVIMVLGTRKAESAHRHQSLNKFKRMRTREHLNPSTTMANELIYPLLEEWSNDNVWQYLMMEKNPWGLSNKDLLTMYRGATADNECPLVISTDTPSCGSSRFGCWVCTVVEKDKSMAAMIDHGNKANDWMIPLMELRNEIGDKTKEDIRRDFRRMDGSLKVIKYTYKNGIECDRLVHGPYKKAVREEWLKKLLGIQENIRQHELCPVENFTIITEAELHVIRQIWLNEKHQFDDSLPQIYKDATGREFNSSDSQKKIFGAEEWNLLKETTLDVADHDEELLFELQCQLLDLEAHASNMRYRHGILSSLENTLQRFYYKNEQDALEFAIEWKEKTESIMREENEPQGHMAGNAEYRLGEQNR